MALVLADRVLETSTSEGLGTFALAGAQTGYQTFSNGIGNGNTCYYTINGQTTEQWEVGIGTVGAGTLARTTLISSNTGSFINFVAGVKNVFVTQPASKSIYKDASGNAIPLGSASATQLDITAQGDLRLQDTTGGEYVGIQAPATLAASYTLTMPTDDGTSGQALVTDGSGVLSWSSAASGDVYGPASATDNAIARFDGTTGKIIQNSVVTIADTTGNMAGVGTLSSGAITSSGQLTLTNASDYNLYASGVGDNFMQGALGIGTLPAASTITLVGGNLATGAATVNNILVNGSIQSDVTGTYTSYGSNPTTAATAFTLSNLRHFVALQQTLGAGSTVTNQFGFYAFSSLTGATNNYGFYGNIASGANRYNFYANGTAANYFAGNVGIGTTTMSQALNVTAVNASGFAGQRVQNNNGSVGIAGVEFSSDTTYAKAAIGLTRNQPNGVGILSIYNAASTAAADWATTDARIQIDSSGFVSLGAAVGSESLRVTPVASSVNYVEILGGATGTGGRFFAGGSDANIVLDYVTKGTSAHNFYTGATSAIQFKVTNTASAVDFIQVTGNSGGFPNFSAAGASTNISIGYGSKGSGSHIFSTNGIATNQFVVAHTASAVNYISVFGGPTGSGGYLQASGSDTNIPLVYSSKGNREHAFYTAGNSFTQQFQIAHTASAVNYLQVTGAATAGGPVLSAQGSDTNIDLALTPKGTGVLAFGTHTAGVVAQAGYISIKDSAGNVRRLLVG